MNQKEKNLTNQRQTVAFVVLSPKISTPELLSTESFGTSISNPRTWNSRTGEDGETTTHFFFTRSRIFIMSFFNSDQTDARTWLNHKPEICGSSNPFCL